MADSLLTYRVYRRGTTAPIHTEIATAPFWDLPTMSFTDTGLTPGTTQEYRVTATDPFGNVAQSQFVASTVAAAGSVSEYVIEDLEPGNIKYTDEVRVLKTSTRAIQLAVNAAH